MTCLNIEIELHKNITHLEKISQIVDLTIQIICI